MSNNNKSRPLTRAIMRIFTPKRITDRHKLHPIAYYRRVYLSKPIFEGMEFLAKTRRVSKIKMTNALLQRGISSLLGEEIGQYILTEREAREHGQKLPTPRIVRELRRLAKTKGQDISKII